MAIYKIMTWRGIPAQVKVTDGSGTIASRQMPPFFQQEIDRVAMREGLIDSEEYLESWQWSAEQERAGPADEIADQLVGELEEQWQRSDRDSGP